MVLGTTNTSSKILRLEVTFQRDSETLKKLIYTHIKYGNIIVTYIWAGYNWLQNDINYIHSTLSHDHGNFGYGFDSIIHFESICGNLQMIIKKLYYSIESQLYTFSDRIRFRRDISGLSNNDKWIEFKNILN